MTNSACNQEHDPYPNITAYLDPDDSDWVRTIALPVAATHDLDHALGIIERILTHCHRSNGPNLAKGIEECIVAALGMIADNARDLAVDALFDGAIAPYTD